MNARPVMLLPATPIRKVIRLVSTRMTMVSRLSNICVVARVTGIRRLLVPTALWAASAALRPMLPATVRYIAVNVRQPKTAPSIRN